MFKMGLTDALRGLVDQMVPRSYEHIVRVNPAESEYMQPGVKFLLDLRLSFVVDHETDNEAQVSTFLHLMFCGGTHVFAATTDHPLTQVKPEDWFNVGNHDSCWIDALGQHINKLYFEMADGVVDGLDLSGAHPDEEDPRPVDMDQYVHFTNLLPMSPVYVTHKKDKERNQHGDSYWRVVTAVDPAELRMEWIRK